MIFSILALTPSVKPLGIISIFAPIGMFDLKLNSILDPLCKVGKDGNRIKWQQRKHVAIKKRNIKFVFQLIKLMAISELTNI
jgi:hypothetical protein